jgi:hypothetical protein
LRQQLRSEHGIAAHLAGLLPALADAAHDHIVNGIRIDTGPTDQGIKRGSGQINRVNPGQPPAAPPAGGAYCINDIGGGHKSDSLLLDDLTDRLRLLLQSVKRASRDATDCRVQTRRPAVL